VSPFLAKQTILHVHEAISIIFRLIYENIVLIARALRHQFIIPDFVGFTRIIEEIYESVKDVNEGKVNENA